MKRTYQIKLAKLVPVFAARWRSTNKYFNSSESKRPEKNDARYNNNIKKTPYAYTKKENPRKIQKNKVKTIIIPNSI
jgi:hypothetical protein